MLINLWINREIVEKAKVFAVAVTRKATLVADLRIVRHGGNILRNQPVMYETLKKALIIFAKLPSPGAVKTRMIPALSPHEAAELYKSMLHDILAKVRRLNGLDKYLFYCDENGAGEYFEEIADGMNVLPQGEGDLGERMEEAFRHLFDEGYGSVAIIGTDSPDLPVLFIEMAYELLRNDVEAVYGPSDDGGYYLIAMNRLESRLFTGIPWSSGEVLEKSLEIARAGGVKLGLLPLWHDVDTVDALMRPELLDEHNDAPRTRAFIQSRRMV